MAYVEAHASLREHPKTKKLARLLNISRASAIGHLLCLWWWCQEYADDGDLSAYEPADIAEAADWDGDASVFVEALLTCGMKDRAGFLARTEDDALLVNDWQEYGGKLSIKRQQARERMRTMRNKENPVTRNTSVTDENVTRNVRNVTHIDQIRSDQTRSDKKIEDAVRVTSGDSVCLSVCLSDAAHLLEQHSIEATDYRIEQTSRAISDYGMETVKDAFAVAANKGKKDWNYISGIMRRMSKPSNGAPAVNGNGARDLSGLVGFVPGDAV
jgi:hypothetical protein